MEDAILYAAAFDANGGIFKPLLGDQDAMVPVVPKVQARIRVQMSADHTAAHIEQAIAAFAKIGRELRAISGQ